MDAAQARPERLGRPLTWLIEFAAHEARPVPREATTKVRGSKGTGAIA